MAGRPRKMAKRVSAFEQRALDLFNDMFDARPEQYREHPNEDDPLNAAWNDAVGAVTSAMNELEALGDLLREKAGITDPGPTAVYFAEIRAQAKGDESDVAKGGEGQEAVESPVNAELGGVPGP